MPPRINLFMAALLSFFLLAGPAVLMFSPLKNAGFGTGFVAAAIIIFLYRLLQLRRFELQIHLKGEPYGTAAGRAAYSTLSIAAVVSCVTVFISAVLQSSAQADIYRLMASLTAGVFLLFIWLYMLYQSRIEE